MDTEIRIESLHRGDRFYMLLEITGRRIYGTVLQITAGSVLVKLDPRGEGREITRLNKLTGEYDTVKIAPQPKIEYWSLDTPVFVTNRTIETPQLALGIGQLSG